MELLKEYCDKAFINSVICGLSYNFYSSIYNVSHLPTILGSSILTLLNSTEMDIHIMKKINITINGLNAVILALINAYKLSDRINNFKNSQIKFNKLNHLIESYINKQSGGNGDEQNDKIIAENFINEFDRLQEEINYQFPEHIRKKVIKKYGGNKTLPNSLDIDYQSSVRLEKVEAKEAKEGKIDLVNITVN